MDTGNRTRDDGEQSVKKGKKRDTKKAEEQGNLRKKVVPLLLTTMLKFELAEQSRNRRHGEEFQPRGGV
ncbi:Protein CBG18716 [Caenorhabditis briggsae]|uniref:Protein CBG18716 n=2 Tax=Caenorhabditis briggsae TaxID=6238 RepID=A8XTZ2_CAEBR|nr:Protein CBG18716 [Caenorhabditis briggsae]ULU03901.1 hypothetical protein L3Y34_016994 [Caenorhabditis briggsae]CAP36118.1 Protein CBG18716 [Caenorhabditis briggsae]